MWFWSPNISVDHDRRKVVVRRRVDVAVVLAGVTLYLAYQNLRAFVFFADFWFLLLPCLTGIAAWLAYRSGVTVVTVRDGLIYVRPGLIGYRLDLLVADVEEIEVIRPARTRRVKPGVLLFKSRLQLVARLGNGTARVVVPNLGSRHRAEYVRRAILEWASDTSPLLAEERAAAHEGRTSRKTRDVERGPASALLETPPGFSVFERGVELVVRKSWRSARRWKFVGLWCMAFVGLPLFLILPWLVETTTANTSLAVTGGILVVNLILCVLWLTACTVVVVDGRTVRIRHRRGLLGFRNTLEVANIARFRVVRIEQEAFRGHIFERDEVGTSPLRFFRFWLEAVSLGGGRIRLVPNLESRADARFLGRTLADRLSIPMEEDVVYKRLR